MKTLLKKLSSQALSCITNQPFSSDNNSSIWGGVDPQLGGRLEPAGGACRLWSTTCNRPANLFSPSGGANSITDLGVMRPSIETLTSVGHTTISDHPDVLIDTIAPTLQQNSIILTPLEIVTCIPKPAGGACTFLRSSLTSAAEQIASTPTTPISMDQVDVDIQQLVSDDVIKVIEEVTRFF
jgi:hypothetical protein